MKLFNKVSICLVLLVEISLMKCQCYQKSRQRYDLVKVRATGFLPHETDILPYAIIQRIYQMQQQPKRDGRQLQQWQQKLPLSGKSLNSINTAAKAQHKAQLRLQSARPNSKFYKLYDDDGEYLLDIKYHNAVGVGVRMQRTIKSGNTPQWPQHEHEHWKETSKQMTIAPKWQQKNANEAMKMKRVQHIWLQL